MPVFIFIYRAKWFRVIAEIALNYLTSGAAAAAFQIHLHFTHNAERKLNTINFTAKNAADLQEIIFHQA